MTDEAVTQQLMTNCNKKAQKYRMKFIETSVVDNLQIREVFEELSKEIFYDTDVETYEKEMKMIFDEKVETKVK